MKKYNISKSKEFYQAWPSLVKLENDDLFCIFTQCNHHIQRDNSLLMFAKSNDRGRIWSEAKPFTGLTNKEAFFNNARVQRMGDSIVVVCDKVYENENSESPADVFMWISDDETKTFTEPIKTAACGIVPDIRQISNGDWILTAHRKDPVSGKLVQYAWISPDRGKSWSDEIVVGKSPDYNLCEASILECSDKTLVAFMRENSFMGYDCIKAISTDGGYTWGELYHAAIPGCHRPTVGYLNDGRVMLTYRFFHGESTRGENTFLALFDEETAKETDRRSQKIRLMPLDFDRHESQDCGYTDWVQFDDDEIYIVNYIKDNWDKGQIRGYSLNLNDIVL